jgi:hypothetical protein
MIDPQPASLFQRDRTPVPAIVGLEKTEAHPALHLPLFCRILTVDFHSALTSGEGVATLNLEAAPIAAPHLRMHCSFRNVREFALTHLPAEGFDCPCFAIDDARHLGNPNINWEVGDTKTGTFHFYAQHAEIVSVVFES